MPGRVRRATHTTTDGANGRPALRTNSLTENGSRPRAFGVQVGKHLLYHLAGLLPSSQFCVNTGSEIDRRKLTLAIQAGGFSRRMGRDKALLPFEGQPLIQYIINRGKTLTDDLIVTANQAGAYPFLTLPVYADSLPERGTLVGLHTALSAARRPLVAVIGCDMPFFSTRLLAFQARQLEEDQWDAVVPRTRDGLEPLHGVYRRESCLRGIHQALDRNIHSLIAWLKPLRVLEIAEAQSLSFGEDARPFFNINTPEDYQRAQGLAREQTDACEAVPPKQPYQ